MMHIKVAGAGAGKTTNMAQNVAEYYKTVNPYKNIYCIAFTNNAVSRIKTMLQQIYGVIPANIKVSTIHSFLYQEIVKPYYYLLYGIHYHRISLIALPDEPGYRVKKLKELDELGILHTTVIPQRAKWVMSRKSSDRAQEKTNRKLIQSVFASYCEKIYIDEAQDIDSDMLEIIESLHGAGVEISLVGDPKQDLRGHGCFRTLINHYAESVEYCNICHRCPEAHLLLSNSLISKEERQLPEKEWGSIDIIFESQIALNDIVKKPFDLMYIYQKNDRIETHRTTEEDKRIENLQHEIKKKLHSLAYDEFVCKICAYNYAAAMIYRIDSGDKPKNIMARLIEHTGSLSKEEYASIISLLNPIEAKKSNCPIVSSIESIKGLDGENCLFILTGDLAAYLLQEKTTENKTKNALYVALTRSSRNLTIYVPTEVESKYTQEQITAACIH